jgi:hypothetical protein
MTGTTRLARLQKLALDLRDNIRAGESVHLNWRRPAIAVVFITVIAIAFAETGEMRLTPSEVKWPAGGSSLVGTSAVSGIQTVTLKGDPSKSGVYAILLRVGPNTRIDAHAHPDDRVATVVSGTWYFG